MRNLKLLELDHIQVVGQLSEARFIAVDYDTKVVYTSTKNGILALDPVTRQIHSQVDLTKDGYLTGDGKVRIIGIQYLTDNFSACAATSSGELILWNPTSGEIECVGTVDSGFQAMAWSPGGEIVVLATGAGTIILMTRDFDPLLETSMHPGEFGEAQPITVGWGAKETQFHGSAGKHAAKAKAGDVTPASAWDDQQPRITWRGDGQYFAVSTISPETGARKVRVWTREGGLHSTSENASGLEPALAWKPSGSLVAASLRKPNKHTVSFFELNGLLHGAFDLHFGPKEVVIKELLWNTDSTVLCVWCEDMQETSESKEAPKSRLQLWTVNNYHWYLKQSIDFDDTTGHVVAADWDLEHAYHLHVLCAGGDYFRYAWSWSRACNSPGHRDQALVGVIDGNKALLTPFRHMTVPPPLCAFHVQLNANVNEIVFMKDGNFAVIGCDGMMSVYKYSESSESLSSALSNVKAVAAGGGSGFNVMCPLPATEETYSLPRHGASLFYTHFTFLSDTRLVFCAPHADGMETKLYIADVNQEKRSIDTKEVISIPGVIIGVECATTTSAVALQLNDGTILRINPDQPEVFCPWEDACGKEIQFPIKCPQMKITAFGGVEAIVGLTDTFRLYVNGVEVANNCTSFVIHEEYLLLTTLSHTLRCISLCTELDKLPLLADGKEHPFDESIRRVERGARIVTVAANDTKLILQMPRGNLEAIHPRALVLSRVRKLLDDLEFGAAFELMRKHRINMNLLHDHEPQAFVAHVSSFVAQISQVSYINLFLTDLREEDVTATMYTAAYDRAGQPAAASRAKPAATTKVDAVCDAVRAALESADPDRYLLSILTAYVKKSTPELYTALHWVRGLKEKEKGGHRGSVGAEEALKYLLFLVDVNEMYDVALGTYDFDLVLMVAERSQKDPKEYLPFLNDLRKMEDNYQKYTIDLHLRRYDKALQHICKCGDEHFAECLNLIKQNKLYSQALELYPINSGQYQAIASSYGEYLFEKKAYEEAGIVLAKADESERALTAFQNASNWRRALILALKMKYTPDRTEALARRLADKLKSERRCAEAACVLEQYANDVEEAIVVLIEGAQWEEALRLMYKHGRTDFIESDFKTALADSCSQMEALLDDTQGEFEKYKVRLAVVREKKERERIEFLEGGGRHNEADADLFSDASSATGESVISATPSRFSNTSGASSQRSGSSKSSGGSRKSRRKTERKKWSLKEGSTYENFALIEALSKIYKQAEEWREDIYNLSKMLITFYYDKKASGLQEKFQLLLKLLESSVGDIWNPELEGDGHAGPVTGPDTTANVIAAAIQQGQRMAGKADVQLDPNLKIPPDMKSAKPWKLQLV